MLNAANIALSFRAMALHNLMLIVPDASVCHHSGRCCRRLCVSGGREPGEQNGRTVCATQCSAASRSLSLKRANVCPASSRCREHRLPLHCAHLLVWACAVLLEQLVLCGMG